MFFTFVRSSNSSITGQTVGSLTASVLETLFKGSYVLAKMERPLENLVPKPEPITYPAEYDAEGELISEERIEEPYRRRDFGEATLAEVKAGSEAVVDFLAGETREYFVSQGQLIQEEYRYARVEAQQWVDAGKPDDAIPDAVQVWMDANDMTADEVVADIEQTALAWEAALGAIRNARLTAKGAIRKATDIATVQQAVQTARDQFEQVKATAT